MRGTVPGVAPDSARIVPPSTPRSLPRATLAIAGLTIRETLRSRLLFFLTAVLLLVGTGLPLLIKGDGTPTGQVRIVLDYTLGVMAILMAVVTLWISCAALSRDIENRHLRLTLVKPVHRHQVWLGRWLGILALNAALLFLCGAAACAMVRWTTGQASLGEEEKNVLSEQILVGRRRMVPRQPDIAEESQRRLEQLQAQRRVPDGVPDDAVRDMIRKQVIAERTVLPPGRQATWTLNADDVPTDAAVSLRFRFSSPMRTTQPARGTWSIGRAGQPGGVTLPDREFMEGTRVIPLQGGLPLPSEAPLQVRFQNGDAGTSHTIVFPPEGAVELLIRESGFEMNLVRALLVLLCQLAVLSALGLTAGALFSFPVASFVTLASVTAVLITHFFVFASNPEHAVEPHHHGGPTPRESVLEHAGSLIIRNVHVVAKPVLRMDVLHLLSDGLLVSWQHVGNTLLILVGIYSGTLGLLGSFVLSRRELAQSQ